MQGTFGDVAITLIKTVSKQATPAPVLASSSTRRHMQTGTPSIATTTASSAAVDPWLAKDRWGGSMAASSGPDRLHQFEARLKEDIATQVRAQLQDTHMEVEDAEPTGLDNRMNQLRSPSKSYSITTAALNNTSARCSPPHPISPPKSSTSTTNSSNKAERSSFSAPISGIRLPHSSLDKNHSRTTWGAALRSSRLSWRSAAGRLDTPRASSSTPRGEAPYITALGYISLHFSVGRTPHYPSRCSGLAVSSFGLFCRCAAATHRLLPRSAHLCPGLALPGSSLSARRFATVDVGRATPGVMDMPTGFLFRLPRSCSTATPTGSSPFRLSSRPSGRPAIRVLRLPSR